MKWMKYSIETITEAEEAVCALLMKLGIDALEIEDNEMDLASIEKEGGYYEELMPDLPKEDNTARVIFYLEEGDTAADSLIQEVEKALVALSKQENIGSGMLSISITDEKDWRDNWKSFFHAFWIGDMLIKPTWEPLPETREAKQIIEIDPGISFGTGQHETTKMCIEWLQRYVKPEDVVLDVGFGSGILSVAALKLGAQEVVGTDIDADCLESAASNFIMNGLATEEAIQADGNVLHAGSGTFYIGDLRTDEALQKQVGEGQYTIAVANILADIVIGLKDNLLSALKPGGILICSGIIDFKEEAVIEAFDTHGFEIIEKKHLGEWVSVVGRKIDGNVSH